MGRIILCFLTIFLFNFPTYADNNDQPRELTKKEEFDYIAIDNQDVVLGNRNAKVKIIEFSSLSCPHCAHFHMEILPEIKAKYIDTGKVAYIHRHFPIDKQSLKGAILTHCAGKDKYYLFLKVLFEKQLSWVQNQKYLEILANIGRLGGISNEEFNKCFNDNAIELQIANQRLKAVNILKINATPTFVLNNKIFAGLYKFEAFEKMIEEELKK